ncbi:hypothetical protein PS910_00694 [Pseudomonas fluorescens]|nr:hypothetical protein PS910_00694 [Pseudomonas fluorescens]
MIKEADYEEGCPIAHEVGNLALLNLHWSDGLGFGTEKNRAAFAIRVVESIHSKGGLATNMGSEQCKRLFKKKPYFAHAYLSELALLHGNLFPDQKSEWSRLLLHPNIKAISAPLHAPDGSPILQGLTRKLENQDDAAHKVQD